MAETETTTLCETDILLWSEQQAELLHRRSANALDWDNLAEEIEGVGLNELHAVMSHLTQADRKSTRLNSSHSGESRMPSSA